MTATQLPPPPAPPASPKRSFKDRYRFAPEMPRLVAAGVVALGLFIVTAGVLGVPLALLAAGIVGYCVAEHIPAKTARTLALALAVWSHGPAAGVEADRCYPARAKHFLRYIRHGENRRVVPKRPEQGRWCAHCGIPEWCIAPDGSVHAHDYEPMSKESI